MTTESKVEIGNVVAGTESPGADGRTMDLIDPSTGEAYGTAPLSGPQDVDRAMAAAASAFETWRDTTPAERQRALLRIADAFEQRAEELVAAESRNTGKPVQLTLDEEIPPAVDQIRFFAGAARLLEGRSAGEYMAEHTSYVRREPVGVCAQVTPWNYPLMMAIWKFAPAIAAGNTVVLKPSDTTPVSCLPAYSTWSPATGTPAGRWWPTRPRRWSRSPARSGPAGRSPPRPASTSSAPTSSSAARRRWSSSTTPTSS
jgi:betaine-aldehyde dehydrogenase